MSHESPTTVWKGYNSEKAINRQTKSFKTNPDVLAHTAQCANKDPTCTMSEKQQIVPTPVATEPVHGTGCNGRTLWP